MGIVLVKIVSLICLSNLNCKTIRKTLPNVLNELDKNTLRIKERPIDSN